jgi:hypothetical protein
MDLELVAIVAFGAVGAGLGGGLSYLAGKLIARGARFAAPTIEIKTPHGRRVELQKTEDMTDADFERQVRKVIHEVVEEDGAEDGAQGGGTHPPHS